MTAIDRTAYPRPRARLSREELSFRYDLTETDLTFVRANARGDNGRLLLAVLLKSRRDFGCFPGLGEVHAGIVVHVASQLGLETLHPPTDDMRRSSKLYRYQAAVRAHLCVMPYQPVDEVLNWSSTHNMSGPNLRMATLCSGLIAEQRLRQRAAMASGPNAC
jgi:hypothetical protein